MTMMRLIKTKDNRILFTDVSDMTFNLFLTATGFSLRAGFGKVDFLHTNFYVDKNGYISDNKLVEEILLSRLTDTDTVGIGPIANSDNKNFFYLFLGKCTNYELEEELLKNPLAQNEMYKTFNIFKEEILAQITLKTAKAKQLVI